MFQISKFLRALIAFAIIVGSTLSPYVARIVTAGSPNLAQFCAGSAPWVSSTQQEADALPVQDPCSPAGGPFLTIGVGTLNGVRWPEWTGARNATVSAGGSSIWRIHWEATATPETNTSTSTPVPTSTATNTSTSTPVPTSTATNTSTSTPVPTSTATNTSTSTPVPTSTATNTSTSTPVPTSTATNTPTATPSSTPTSTSTATPTATAMFDAAPSGFCDGSSPWVTSSLAEANRLPMSDPCTPGGWYLTTGSPAVDGKTWPTWAEARSATIAAGGSSIWNVEEPVATPTPSATPSSTPSSTPTPTSTSTPTSTPTATATVTPTPTPIYVCYVYEGGGEEQECLYRTNLPLVFKNQ